MDGEDEYGIYEKAYHIVGSLLARDFDCVRFKTYLACNTTLNAYVERELQQSNSDISKPQLFICHPYKVDISGFVLNWGVLAFSPSAYNQIGAIFHHPYEQLFGMELTCGLILDYEHIVAMYGDREKGAIHQFPFTYGDIEDEYKGLTQNKEWQRVIKESPRVYDMITYLTWIVHNSITFLSDDIE